MHLWYQLLMKLRQGCLTVMFKARLSNVARPQLKNE